MTTMVVSIESGANARKIAAAMRQLNGVTKVKVQNGSALERIPGLPYTREEKLASIARSEEELRMGLGISSEQLEKEITLW